MARISHVKGLMKHSRSRVFWFRRAVPPDLRGPDKLGKTEIKFSLKTSDLKHAEALASRHWWEWENKFQTLRQMPGKSKRVPTLEDIAKMALAWRDLWPKADQIEQRSGIVVREVVGPDGKLLIETRPATGEERLAVQRDRLKKADTSIHTNDLEYLRNTAIDILREHGFITDENTVQRLIPAIAKAESRAAEIAAKQERGESALSLLEEDEAGFAIAHTKVTDLLDEYLKDKKPRQQTEVEWRLFFKRLVDVVGDMEIHKIGKRDIRRFRQEIEQLPTRPSHTVRAMPVNQMICYAKQYAMPTLSVETVRKHIGAVRAVFEWAVTNELMENNPAQKMAPKKEASNGKRLPFSQSDLGKIFNWETYYLYPANAADFWIPLVCLYSGARIEEVAQLHCADIQCEENITCLNIAPTGSGVSEADVKSVKTHSSTRRIPIHREVINAGFLDFVKARTSGGQTRLFHELNRNKIGRLATEVSRHFSRYSRSIGIDDPRKSFHSFRHTFKDACRSAEIPEDISDRLTGHSSQSVGRYYGQGHDLSVLQRNLSKVEYPGLSELRWCEWIARQS